MNTNINQEVNGVDFAEIKNQLLDLQYCAINFFENLQRSQIELKIHKQAIESLRDLDSARWKAIANIVDETASLKTQHTTTVAYIKTLHTAVGRQLTVSPNEITLLTESFRKLSL